MSKTDKTDPYWVKAASGKQGVAYKASHDHSRGPCDLPADHRKGLRAGWGKTRCHWTETLSFWMTEQQCGCPMCTGRDERRIERRRSRHNARKVLRTQYPD